MNKFWCWLLNHKYACLEVDNMYVLIVCMHCGHHRKIKK